MTDKEIEEQLKNKGKPFCADYVATDNATEAYRRTFADIIKKENMPPDRVKKNAQIFKERAEKSGILDQVRAEVYDKAEVNATWVIHSLAETAETAMKGAPVRDRNGKQVFVKGKDGDVQAVYAMDGKTAVAALNTLAKHLGLLVDQVVVDTQTGLADILKDRIDKAHGKGKD